MTQNKKILHDISKMASAAFSSAAGVKRDISSYIHSQMEEFLRGMNFVRREEFEALHKITMDSKKRLDAISPSSAKDAKPAAKAKVAAVAKPKAAAIPKKKTIPVKKSKPVAVIAKKAAPVKKTASKKHSPVKGKINSEK